MAQRTRPPRTDFIKSVPLVSALGVRVLARHVAIFGFEDTILVTAGTWFYFFIYKNIFLKYLLFIYSFLAVPGLHCSMQTSWLWHADS